MDKNILVLGATGLVGSDIVPKLLKDESIGKVYTLSRSDFDLIHPKLEKIISKENAFEHALDGIYFESLIICFGTTIKKAGSKKRFYHVDVDMPLTVANRAKKLKCREVHLVSSIGASESSPSFYLKCKGKLEEEMVKLNFDHLSIYRPNVLDGQRNEKRPIEKLGISLGNQLKQLKFFRFLWPTKVSDLTDLIRLNLGNDIHKVDIYSGADLKKI